MIKKHFKKLSYTQLIVLSFALIILIGTTLLSLPISSKSGESTPFLNAMFTATSATCVTGLIVYDTYSHWSLFGQSVIITLIQIGGLGIMVYISTFAMFLKKKISVYERRLLMQASGNIKLGGTVKLLRRIVKGTFITEGIGAVILSVCFIPEMGVAKGILNGIFHSVSAFCNAGFDLMGKFSPFSSLTHYSTNPVVMITIIMLIVIGGIGFLIWTDVITFKFKFKK